nr:WGR domain-containing protein [Sphingomonas sp. TREG-RG-20F-R18-01]
MDAITCLPPCSSLFVYPTNLIDHQCELEAVAERRNIARAYQIDATRDLFGHIIVALRWGRIGKRPAGLTVSFETEAAASRFIQRALAKRASAPRRIGVGYCHVGSDATSPSKPLAANDFR